MENEIVMEANEDDFDLEIRSTFNSFEIFEEFFFKFKTMQKFFDVEINLISNKTSNVWRYFGKLKYKGKTIFDKRNFCKLCLKPKIATESQSQAESEVAQNDPRCEQPAFKR